MNLPTNWSTLAFRMSGAGVQQRVLHALSQVGRPGVSARGAQVENQFFVLLDCERLADEVHAQHVVMSFDRHAIRTTSSRDDIGAGTDRVARER